MSNENDTVYVRSCRHCGEGFDSTNQSQAESARDSHESSCPLNPANQ
jgi:hypothetical protein